MRFSAFRPAVRICRCRRALTTARSVTFCAGGRTGMVSGTAEFSASDHAPDRRDHWRYTRFRHDRLASALKLLLFAASPVPSFAPAGDGLIDGGER